MEYLYQIKIAPKYSDTFSRPVATQGIVARENKKEVIRYLEEKYPEYFDGNKVAQKLSKKVEQVVYVSIYELDDYWKKYWKQEVECMICHRKVPLIEVKNQLGGYIDLKHFTCSVECEKVREERSESREEEFWNERCPYYFIYRIANKVNGKCYIGYTAREPLFRWWEHFQHSSLPIGKALKEEGIENFTFEVLEKHLKNEKTIEEMHGIETCYMNQYDSIRNGYNCMVSKNEDYKYCGSVLELCEENIKEK